MFNKPLSLIIKQSTWLYVLWVVLIAILTLLPGNVIPDVSWEYISIDKAVHVFLFSGLSFLGLTAINYKSLHFFGSYTQLISIITAIGYGYLLELIQSYIPERSYDFADFAADSAGTIVGYGLFLGMSKILPPKHS